MHQPRRLKSKIKTLDELVPLVEELKKQGLRIVFTNGCFDILHAGHVNLMEESRDHGDVLVAAMNSDASVRGLKGPDRPVVPQGLRAEVLASLESVDYVVIFDEPTPQAVIEALVPHVLVKGGDWSPDAIVGREVVEGAGGAVVSIPLKYGASTTDIITTIIERFAENVKGKA